MSNTIERNEQNVINHPSYSPWIITDDLNYCLLLNKINFALWIMITRQTFSEFSLPWTFPEKLNWNNKIICYLSSHLKTKRENINWMIRAFKRFLTAHNVTSSREMTFPGMNSAFLFRIIIRIFSLLLKCLSLNIPVINLEYWNKKFFSKF